MFLDSYVEPFFDETESLLRDKVEELLRPYVEGYALPLERKMVVRRTECPNTPRRGSRTAGLSEDCTIGASPHVEDQNGGAGWAEKTIDLMEAYYEVRRVTPTFLH